MRKHEANKSCEMWTDKAGPSKNPFPCRLVFSPAPLASSFKTGASTWQHISEQLITSQSSSNHVPVQAYSDAASIAAESGFFLSGISYALLGECLESSPATWRSSGAR